jgi:hypothetical protein
MIPLFIMLLFELLSGSTQLIHFRNYELYHLLLKLICIINSDDSHQMENQVIPSTLQTILMSNAHKNA